MALLQVGVRGNDVVVLGVEKKSIAKLQEERTVRKICLLDEHVVMAFAGLISTDFFGKLTVTPQACHSLIHIISSLKV